MMKYKGYTGHVEYDDELKIFHGEIIDTKDVITFQGKTVDELENAFRDSIYDYIEFCAKRGEKPEKPFSGKFVIRIPSELHHCIYIRSKETGKSINNWILDILKEAT